MCEGGAKTAVSAQHRAYLLKLGLAPFLIGLTTGKRCSDGASWQRNLMKIVEETLRKLIEFSEKQRVARMRHLKAEGKVEEDATATAYGNVINQLSSVLPKKDDSPAP